MYCYLQACSQIWIVDDIQQLGRTPSDLRHTLVLVNSGQTQIVPRERENILFVNGINECEKEERRTSGGSG